MSERGVGIGQRTTGAGREPSMERYVVVSALSVIAIFVLCAFSVWGQWRRMAVLLAAAALLVPLNLLLIRVASRPGALARAELLKNLVNCAGTALAGRLCGWPLPMWLFLPLNAVWFVDL